MLCGKPVSLPLPYRDKMVPCGQCMACRINKRRQWTARILLEASRCAQSVFVTLTYDQENVPRAVCDGLVQEVLVPDHLSEFIRALRDSKSMGKIRFFGCGEYGENTQRPHYHVILFGKHVNQRNEEIISAAWGKGFISISELNEQRAAYTAAYTTKKMSKEGDFALAGRPREFTRMSTNPGIAGESIPYLATLYHRNDGSKRLADMGDIDTTVRINGKIYPLDGYLQKKMRAYLDLPQLKADRLFAKWGDNPPPEKVKDYAKAAKKNECLEINSRGKHGTL